MPSVEQVLKLESTCALLENYRRDYVVGLVRRVLQRRREALIKSGAQVERQTLLAEVERELAAAAGGRPSLRRTINATGIVLHTGLGRAPLAAEALEALEQVGEHYCNLEYDLEEGRRGSRLSHVEELLCAAAEAEAAAVVNNNAAAVMLAINTHARGREVLVSRGQLVEIGGSFRLPEIIAASGACIREVGTTNRTHLRDYQAAIGPGTAMILVVHPSNYRVCGFSAEVGLEELAPLSRRAGVLLAYDLGGGVLQDLSQWSLPPEPVVRHSLKAGADLVSFSGDKVLGGPQSGIIAGRRACVDALKKNPLMRALRCDKLILAALEATLRLYARRPESLRAALPVLRLMSAPLPALEARARRLLEMLPDPVRRRLRPALEPSVAQAGSGALPLEELPSRALVLAPDFAPVEELARRLRLDECAVVGRIHRERLVLDMRTLRDEEVGEVAAALVRAAQCEE